MNWENELIKYKSVVKNLFDYDEYVEVENISTDDFDAIKNNIITNIYQISKNKNVCIIISKYKYKDFIELKTFIDNNHLFSITTFTFKDNKVIIYATITDICKEYGLK